MERRNGNFRLKLERKHDFKNPSSCKIMTDALNGVGKTISVLFNLQLIQLSVVPKSYFNNSF